ncbi:MAG: hypothetical protein WD767_08235 [Alphaproteobacteria bacterium]
MNRYATIFCTTLLALSACDGAEPVAEAAEKAQVRLDLIEFTYEFAAGRHRYNHRRLFTETAGTGVTVTRGKVCVLNGEECADALVNYRIEALQTLEQKGHYVATPVGKDRITLQYWAEDDAGNRFEFTKIVTTDGRIAVSE